MSVQYTPERIEELRRIAAELDYDAQAIAAREHVAVSTVWWWSSKGWLTPPGKSLRDMRNERRKRQICDALQAAEGDMTAAAKMLCLSPHHVACYIKRFGLREFRKSCAPIRRCVYCQREYRNYWKSRMTCSDKCAAARRLDYARKHNWTKRYGSADEIGALERLSTRYREAIWNAWGNLTQAAEALGKKPNTLYAWVRGGDDRRAWVRRARGRKRDPEQLRQLLEEHNWNISAASRAIGMHDRWLAATARAAGEPDAVLMAPCIECGRIYRRSGPRKRGCCSKECRMQRNRAWFRARYQRLKAERRAA